MKTAASEWARCKHWIAAALEHGLGLETLEDVERAIEDGSYQFWAGPNSAAITEIAEHAQGKALYVRHGGGPGALGELTEELEPTLCAFARANGCKLLLVEGRDGWRFVGRHKGYALGYVTMVKRL